MPTDKMTVDERRKHLGTKKNRYNRTNTKAEKQLLGETEMATGQHRKSLIRLPNSSLERKPRNREPGNKHGPGLV
jgi:hypothetical protein